MVTTVNRETYEQMIREDIAALPESMPSLERDHVIMVLAWSVRFYDMIAATAERSRESV